jgi:nucleotide-binding universal stress UspA family protein
VSEPVASHGTSRFGSVMNKVLCATDLSPASEPALAVAVGVARAMGAELELLHVIHMAPGLSPELMTSGVVDGLVAAAETRLKERADEIRARGVRVATSVKVGLVDDRIAESAAGADLLVVGTHGRQGAKRFFLGSNAERAVREAPCPVLVVPAASAGANLATWEPSARPLKITAAVDLSQASDGALAWLRRLRETIRFDLRLAHVYWPPREHERLGLDPPDPFQPDPAAIQALEREVRRHVATQWGPEELPLRVRPVWGEDASPLAWEAQSDDADLLVMGNRQESGGSTTIATIRASRVPVLCVPTQVAAVHKPMLDRIRHVLVTTDFSPLANVAIAEAYRVIAWQGTVTLLHVAKPPEAGKGGADESDDQIAANLLRLVPAGVDAHRIASRTLVVRHPAPDEAIVQAIRRLGPDLIVMASHGRTGLGRALRGSIAEYVLRHAPTPVLVVPPGEQNTR